MAFARLFRISRGVARAGLIGLSIVASAALAGGPSDSPIRTAAAADDANDRFIVKLREGAAEPQARIAAVAGRSGRALTYVRAMSGGAHVVRVPATTLAATAGQTRNEAKRQLAQQLMLDPDVAYVEPDRKLYPLLVPNDPLYPQQWNYFEAAGGINLPAAWDITTGSTGVVVAVIDTGIRPHPDLANRTVPGYDFIGDTNVSNDGDGRDADPSDPGDYGCGLNSSWHGTHVSGTVGAASNDGAGVAGVNWVSKILPARVLGKCGGYTSDIVDAMRWAAGMPIVGVPANANPARVENLSLGGTETCSNTFQRAIDDVVGRGTVVVVAAGNENADAATSEPANCNNVIAVGATLRNGGRASFSNYGSRVALSAPGASILSTLNAGTTTPGADNYAFYSGTSMSAPHVAGVASLMLSQNPALTPAQVKTRLMQTARAFPTGTGSDCNTALCGAGIVDAAAALAPANTTARFNFALQANGGVASASSTITSGYPPSAVNNGDRRGVNWETAGSGSGGGGGWNDATGYSYPDWIRIDFPAVRTLTEVDVFTIQDAYQNPAEPTEALTFSTYGITAFDVQYWNGSTWVTVPGGSISNTNKVWNKFTFQPIATTSIRVQINASLQGYSRVIEIEAYGDAPRVNAALPANGGSASASSTITSGYPPSAVINGDRRGINWETGGSGSGGGGGWNDATGYSFPDLLQITFDGTKSINEVDVFTIQDAYQNPSEPTETMTFTQYGITDFDVQYWNGSTWTTVPGGSVNGNNKVWRKFTFAPVSTSAIRLNIRGGAQGYSRVIEVEAYVAQ